MQHLSSSFCPCHIIFIVIGDLPAQYNIVSVVSVIGMEKVGILSMCCPPVSCHHQSACSWCLGLWFIKDQRVAVVFMAVQELCVIKSLSSTLQEPHKYIPLVIIANEHSRPLASPVVEVAVGYAHWLSTVFALHRISLRQVVVMCNSHKEVHRVSIVKF